MALLDDAISVADLVGRVNGQARIAFDAEGDGFFRYTAQLCTVQIASEDSIDVVDTLAVEPASLASLLGPDGPEKVVHDAAFDVRLLRDAGVRFGKLFDTSIAARFLGESATGLASLVKKYFGIALSKEQQQADWGRRPIDDRSIRYLEDDVRHLLPLAALLEESLHTAGIEAEVREECDWVITNAQTETPDDRPPWTRIKGARELSLVARAVLREVSEVREAHARERDLAPFRIAPNAALVELANKRPKLRADVHAVPGLGKGRARALADELLAAVKRGEARGAPPEDEDARLRAVPIPVAVRDVRRRRRDALSSFRAAEAKLRGVDPQVVLPGHCLADLVDQGATSAGDFERIAGFGEVRTVRYGEKLLALLAGAER